MVFIQLNDTLPADLRKLQVMDKCEFEIGEKMVCSGKTLREIHSKNTLKGWLDGREKTEQTLPDQDKTGLFEFWIGTFKLQCINFCLFPF